MRSRFDLYLEGLFTGIVLTFGMTLFFQVLDTSDFSFFDVVLFLGLQAVFFIGVVVRALGIRRAERPR